MSFLTSLCFSCWEMFSTEDACIETAADRPNQISLRKTDKYGISHGVQRVPILSAPFDRVLRHRGKRCLFLVKRLKNML
ncbi:hypothetical protein CLOM621_08731 [Clostridium sp. M62/1]|nr:hypothetical protein CLOM621_08731 [Clostridium sp. M62/1]